MINTKKIYIISTDLFHVFLGLITILSAKYNYILSNIFIYNTSVIIPFIILFIYIVYQILDDDDPIEKTSDLIEFMLGMVFGIVL